MYGGTCINVGCIPSKSLIVSAASSPKGDFDEKDRYFKKAIEEKKRVTSFLREKNYQKVINAKVDVILGTASFLDSKTIKVKTEKGEEILTGDKIFIDTGSSSRLPPIPGLLETDGVLTSTSIMELDSLPSRLTIIGAGYIGLEFASMFASFGSKVTILSDGTAFLPEGFGDVGHNPFKHLVCLHRNRVGCIHFVDDCVGLDELKVGDKITFADEVLWGVALKDLIKAHIPERGQELPDDSVSRVLEELKKVVVIAIESGPVDAGHQA